MDKLINKGLNFTILPFKLDITEVLVDFKRFARSTIWHEFWYGKEDNQDTINDIFRNKDKTNLPKNYQIPKGLQTFLNSVKSEILDPKNRNSTECNISPEEQQAIKELVRLQKERLITIKECDKGAGVMILNFTDYISACYEHLTSQQQQDDGSFKPYYTKVDELKLIQSEGEITKVLEDALNDKIITEKRVSCHEPYKQRCC